VEDKKYLHEAHSLSRKYIEVEAKPLIVEFKAVKEKGRWVIVKDNKDVVAENKRPLVALSVALKQTEGHKINHIKICDQLETLLKNINKNQLSNEMKLAIKTIDSFSFSTKVKI
jgi:hypothetical protein